MNGRKLVHGSSVLSRPFSKTQHLALHAFCTLPSTSVSCIAGAQVVFFFPKLLSQSTKWYK